MHGIQFGKLMSFILIVQRKITRCIFSKKLICEQRSQWNNYSLIHKKIDDKWHGEGKETFAATAFERNISSVTYLYSVFYHINPISKQLLSKISDESQILECA